MWNLLNRRLSAGDKAGKLLIFIFHRVLLEPDPLLPFEPDVVQFNWMMRLISRNFCVLPLLDAVSQLETQTLPPAAACVTFDDGYRDNVEVALPILRRYGVPATFFVATEFLNGGRMWNDDVIESVRKIDTSVVDWTEFGLGCHSLKSFDERRACLNRVLPVLKYFPHVERQKIARVIARRAGLTDRSPLMMDRIHLNRLVDAGMDIGAHTHTHPILGQIPLEDARNELEHNRCTLESIIQRPICAMAYPNGDSQRDISSRDAELVREMGFLCALTTDRGFCDHATDPYLMPRFLPWDRTPFLFATRCAMMLGGLWPALNNKRTR